MLPDLKGTAETLSYSCSAWCSVPESYFLQMGVCYLLTIAIETTVLLVGLSKRHSTRVKLFAGVWLSACTYPVVWLVLPPLFDMYEERWAYLLVAETFAPVAECLLFWIAFIRPQAPAPRASHRDLLVIVAANLASFGAGEAIHLWL